MEPGQGRSSPRHLSASWAIKLHPCGMCMYLASHTYSRILSVYTVSLGSHKDQGNNQALPSLPSLSFCVSQMIMTFASLLKLSRE